MKKINDGEKRVIAGFTVFFALIFIAARCGVVLRDSEYIELFTIMLAGFVAGGRR